MMNKSNLYVELAEGNYSNRGRAVKLEATKAAYDNTPAWRSYFSFDENLIPFLKENGSLKGTYPYRIFCDEIVLDYDGEDMEDVHKRLKETLRYMLEYLELNDEWIRVYYSGGKGFHIHLPDLFGIRQSPMLPLTLRSTIKDLFGFNPYLDTSMVLSNGLIRLPNSKHNKTGLFKTPLDLSEVFGKTTEQLSKEAEENRDADFFEDIVDVPFKLKELIRTPDTQTEADIANNKAVLFNPGAYMTCMQKLSARGVIEGRTNIDLMRLASWFWKSGLTPDQAHGAMLGWAKDNSRSQEIWGIIRRVWGNNYAYGCFDEVLHEYCDEQCVFFKQKKEAIQSMKGIRKPEDLIGALQEYRKKLKANEGLDLSRYLKCSPYPILPGEVVLIIGDTGMGKSALIQNIIYKEGKKTLYLNLEMSEVLIFRRFLQISNGMSKEDIDIVLDSSDVEQLYNKIAHIEILSDPPDIDELPKLFEHRRDIKVLVVDTTDVINVPKSGSNDHLKMQLIIDGLRRVAQQHSVIVLAIHHITKSSAGEGKLDLQAPAGNRALVTKPDHVLAISGDRNTGYRQIFSLKSRDTEPLNCTAVFHPKTMQFV